MSVNRHRGEIAATFDGKPFRLCLTLGALAELEDAFAAEDLSALVARLSAGRLSASDIVRILGCGLRGAGHAVSDDEVRAMRCEDGIAGFARIVSELLTATFGSAKERPSTDP
ncbi:gene transfer agent family protein [Mesorhizobium australicum]|uniref:Phage tail tube protein, GTA-gp10 n=1 Tax=Mesorhizobium australicum TaxID=536018 RepID=A0A1X7NYB4_9HYPH|nr:gene transfer agent family protein [Mesorhizobium australicum]SMH42852.1 Phage tail tube protein, GTA-gp10 [Mesorhizobium australicum]